MALMVKELAIALLMFARYWLYQGIPLDPEGLISDTKTIRASYDFVIIGAGSSGAVIANRLTEIEEWSVLLIEAGEEESIFGQIPIEASNLQLTNVDWQYTTTPQGNRSCMVMNNNSCPWPKGKSLGGSSAINYMLYVRGNRRDYDLWETEGCTGWSYNDVLPYFLKSEDQQNPYVAKSKYHSTGGYQPVSSSGYNTYLGAAFLQGGSIWDIKSMTIMAKPRQAYLRPIRFRRNLHVTTKSYVTKIMLDQDGTTAVGVQFNKNGKIYQVEANKEVILSAGTVASPQILMLSGIGPKEHLTEKGIKVYADLPVGDNLQDPIALGGFTFLIDPPPSFTGSFFNLPTLLNYTVYGGTPFSLVGGVEAMAFINTKYADPSEEWPDAQLHFVPASDATNPNIRLGHGLTQEFYDEYFGPILKNNTWSVLVNTQRIKSRGTIRLASSDPFDKPIIEPNYFSDPENYDLNVTIEGIKMVLELSKTEGFQKYNTRYYSKPLPGCESYKFGSDEYWSCYVRSYCFTLVHTVGTAKMGSVSDPTTVVDPRLRVKGIKNLRVADCSVMPRVPSGNTNAPAIMLGEKAADIIKEDWGKTIIPFIRRDANSKGSKTKKMKA